MNRIHSGFNVRRAPRQRSDTGLLTLSQLAEASGESVHAVRYYLREGLLQPSRVAANGYRLFDAATQMRLRFVQRAQRLGFSLAEIRGFIGGVQVGEFGSDNALAPCVQLEAFLPAGARAWGRVSVGIRCLAPATWTAYVPAEVRVTGLYLTTTGPISAGQVLSPADVRRQAGELTAQVADVLTDPAQAIGHVARISLAGGRPLAASHLRLPPAVLQGQAVKVVSRGAGFQVANDGVDLSSAADGQGAQVRLANGQVVRGIARNGNIVEITLP